MDPEHVEIVKQGREAIAAWRRAHPAERFDLNGANLGRADLTEANGKSESFGIGSGTCATANQTVFWVNPLLRRPATVDDQLAARDILPNLPQPDRYQGSEPGKTRSCGWVRLRSLSRCRKLDRIAYTNNDPRGFHIRWGANVPLPGQPGTLEGTPRFPSA
jgi:hypothetical protein